VTTSPRQHGKNRMAFKFMWKRPWIVDIPTQWTKCRVCAWHESLIPVVLERRMMVIQIWVLPMQDVRISKVLHTISNRMKSTLGLAGETAVIPTNSRIRHTGIAWPRTKWSLLMKVDRTRIQMTHFVVEPLSLPSQTRHLMY
jgi:hypothetical protein